jgi:hypothetical protein
MREHQRGFMLPLDFPSRRGRAGQRPGLLAFRALAGSAALGGALWLAAAPAAADCQPDGGDPNLIVCTDTDSDGYAAGVDDLEVQVRADARVENGGAAGVSSLDVLNGTTVLVDQTATIDASGDASGGITAGDGADISHLGTMTVSGDAAHGIEIGAASGRVTVGDGASITVTGDDGVGVEVGATSRATNSGRIEIQGVDGVGIRAAAGAGSVTNAATGVISILEDGAVGIETGSGAGQVTNAGLIEVDGANATGIRTGAGDGSDFTVDIVNSGRIEATGNTAIGIDAGPGTLIFNQGTVIGGFGFGAAIRLNGGGNRIGNDVGGVIDGSTSGVAIRGGSGDDTITNLGSIQGDILFGGGNDKYEQAPTGELVGDLDGGAGEDEVLVQTTSEGSFDLDTISNVELLTFEGGTWLVSGSATLDSPTPGVDDGIVVSAGIFAPVGTVAVTGDFLQVGGTGFQVSLDADGTGDRLDLDGTFTIEDGAQLLVTGTGNITGMQTWTIITATGGVVGQYADLMGAGFIDFGAFYLPNEIQLRARRIPYTTAARTSNQFETARYLDDIVAAGAEGDMADVIDQLDRLTFDDFDDAADQISPEIYDSQSQAGLLHTRAFTDVLREKRPGCGVRDYEAYGHPRRTLSACGSRGLSPWGRVIGFNSDHDGSNGHTRYDVNGVGAAVGLDWKKGEQWTVSGGLAVIRSGIDFRGAGNGSLVSLELGAHAGWEGKWLRAGGGLAYGHGWHETRRQIDTLSRRATSDHDGDRVALFGDFGVPIPVGPVVVEPGARMDYVYFAEENTNESGAASLNLDVDEREESVFSTSPGVSVRAEFLKRGFWTWWTEWMDGTWRPEAFVRYQRTWVGADRNIQASLGGAPSGTGSFGVDANQADAGVEFGARLAFQPLESDATVGVTYSAFTGDDTWTNRATLDVRIPLN